MLIPLSQLVNKYDLKIKGVLHIGAHTCEERGVYHQVGIKDENIVWIEGNIDLYKQMKQNKDIIIYNAVVSDKDNEEVDFIITNNGQSSSILELDLHKQYYPNIVESKRDKVKTKTVDTLVKEEKIDLTKLNFLNIDIQGAELLAIKGMKESLKHFDYLYLEVNTASLYKGCGLVKDLDAYLTDYVRVETSMTGGNWGDALYIKRNPDLIFFLDEPYGRLGNQMFKVATALALVWDHGLTDKNIYMPDHGYASFFKFSNRKEGKQGLPLHVEPWPNGFPSCYPIPRNRSIALHGYFQSYKYFDHYHSKIKERFLPKNEELDKLYQQIDPEGNGVVVHIRRGDYCNLQGWTRSLAYYRKAVFSFPSETQFYLFSDDLKWVKEQSLFQGSNFHPVETTKDDLKDLQLMARFSRFIIANSTYSWWAAYLSGSKEVICPEYWFPGQNRDLLPFEKGWNSLKDNENLISQLLSINLPAYCISLKEAKERQKQVKQECDLIGLPVRFYLTELSQDPSEGCNQSHLAVVKIAVDNKYPYVLIMEDDVMFEHKRIEILIRKKISIPTDFDILYLGCNPLRGHLLSRHLTKIENAFCCHAYILSQEACQYILANYDKDWSTLVDLRDLKQQETYTPERMFDVFCGKVLAFGRQKGYGFYPHLAYQRPSFSTLQNKMVDYRFNMDFNNSIIMKERSRDFKEEKSKMPLLSLCITTYGRYDKFLSKNLPRYLVNKYIDEIVICDEDGKDVEKIKKAFKSDKLKLYVNTKVLGPFYNRVKVMSLAKNDWVCLIDSDNFVDFPYFEAIEDYFNQDNSSTNEDTILAPSKASQFDYTSLNGTVITRQNYRSIYNKNSVVDVALNTGNFMINKKLAMKLDMSKETIDIKDNPCSTLYFNILMMEQLNAKIIIVPNMHYEHVVHDDSFYIKNHKKEEHNIQLLHQRLHNLK